MRKRSININDVYKWLVRIYAHKYPDNPLDRLNVDIVNLQQEGKSKERAVLDLALQIGLRVFLNRSLPQEEAISEFLKGEKLNLTKDDPEIQEIVKEVYRDRIYEPSGVMKERKEKPTVLWYLVPIFFSLIGGLIGYVGVKNEDRDMTLNLLAIGFFMFFVDLFVIWFLL